MEGREAADETRRIGERGGGPAGTYLGRQYAIQP